jgi:translation initiation factor IF-2
MSIRLNHALRELNIGIQTAVEFLTKKGDLKAEDVTPNFKLDDAQYNALVNAFKQDAAVKNQAEKLFVAKKDKKHKQKESNKAEDLLKPATKQEYKPLGKIDLDGGAKKQAPAQDNSAKANVDKTKNEKTNTDAQTAAESHASKATHTDEVVKNDNKQNDANAAHESKHENVEANNSQEKNSEQQTVNNNNKQPEANDKNANGQETSNANNSEIFQLKSEKKILSTTRVNVLGKIDLSTLNQNTRPKKKSKEEKRKERENRQGNGNNGGNANAGNSNNSKRKRQRINKERVDIAAVGKQANKQAQQQGKGNNGNNNKKKKNRKPIEVNEEDVARQVKETLARLTNKQSQNKKGAKYRKEKRDAIQERLSNEAKAEKRESKILKLT